MVFVGDNPSPFFAGTGRKVVRGGVGWGGVMGGIHQGNRGRKKEPGRGRKTDLRECRLAHLNRDCGPGSQ